MIFVNAFAWNDFNEYEFNGYLMNGLRIVRSMAARVADDHICLLYAETDVYQQYLPIDACWASNIYSKRNSNEPVNKNENWVLWVHDWAVHLHTYHWRVWVCVWKSRIANIAVRSSLICSFKYFLMLITAQKCVVYARVQSLVRVYAHTHTRHADKK